MVCGILKRAGKRTLDRIWRFRLAKLRVRCLRSHELDSIKFGKIAMGIKNHTAALALGLFLMPPLGFMSPAMGEPAALTKKQSDALNAYNNSRSHFDAILGQRRAQISSNQRLPNLPVLASLLPIPCAQFPESAVAPLNPWLGEAARSPCRNASWTCQTPVQTRIRYPLSGATSPGLDAVARTALPGSALTSG